VCKRFLVGVQEVPSSNLGGPTKFLKDLQPKHSPQAAFWSPIGVQIRTPAARFPEPTENRSHPWNLSPPIKNPTNPTFRS